MNPFTNLFTNHYYINLEKREDRNKNAIHELSKLGIQPNRFDAIKTKDGLVGCALSHIKLLEIAKEKDLPYIIIFEDDVVFSDIQELKYKLKKYINTEYDVLMMGTWFLNSNDYTIINDDLLRVNKSCCSHAYIIKNHYYQTLIDNYKAGVKLKIKEPNNGRGNIDDYWHSIQKKDNWLCFNPPLASQRDGYSDNFNGIRNLYDRILNLPK